MAITQIMGAPPIDESSRSSSIVGGFVPSPWTDEPNVFTSGAVPSSPYSGADIKLVVHFPTISSADPSELLDAIQEMEEMDQLLLVTEGEERSEVLQRMIELQRQINTLNEEVSNPTPTTKTLAEIQTLSYSIYREKGQVRTLGSVYPRGITRGGRTISGSMVFAVFHQHVWREIFEAMTYRSTGVGDWDRYRWTSYLADQMPPLDISISFANEYGNISYMAILGVEFITEGMVMSIEDLFLEGTAQYIARDLDPMQQVGGRQIRPNQGVSSTITGSNLLMDDLRQRSRGRRNPFI